MFEHAVKKGPLHVNAHRVINWNINFCFKNTESLLFQNYRSLEKGSIELMLTYWLNEHVSQVNSWTHATIAREKNKCCIPWPAWMAKLRINMSTMRHLWHFEYCTPIKTHPQNCRPIFFAKRLLLILHANLNSTFQL